MSRYRLALCAILMLALLVGCQSTPATPDVQIVVVTATAAPATETPIPPTATPVPPSPTTEVQVVIVTATPDPAAVEAEAVAADSEVIFTLMNGDNTQPFTMADLKELPVTEGWGGIKSSTGKITAPAYFEGVSLEDLCIAAGLYDESMAANVVADGYKVTLSSKLLMDNKNVIMANMIDGEVLCEKNFPLRLVGAELTKAEMVGAVAQIVLHIDSAGSATSEEASPTEEPELVAEEAAAAAAAEVPEMAEGVLHIYGKAANPWAMTHADLAQFGLEPIEIEHPKKGTITIEGVRLADILAQAEPLDSATKILFTAGDDYTAEGEFAAIMACANCVLAPDGAGFSLTMSGMDTGLWVKDVRLIEIK